MDFVSPLQGFKTKHNNVLLRMPMPQGVALGYIISGLRPEERCRVQAWGPESPEIGTCPRNTPEYLVPGRAGG